MSDLKKVLMERDELSQQEADELIRAAQIRVIDGDNPEDVLFEEFGLEPDYFFDLMENLYPIRS